MGAEGGLKLWKERQRHSVKASSFRRREGQGEILLLWKGSENQEPDSPWGIRRWPERLEHEILQFDFTHFTVRLLKPPKVIAWRETCIPSAWRYRNIGQMKPWLTRYRPVLLCKGSWITWPEDCSYLNHCIILAITYALHFLQSGTLIFKWTSYKVNPIPSHYLI